MSDSAKLDLDALEAAERAATPGPWRYDDREKYAVGPDGDLISDSINPNDDLFAVAMRNAALELFAAARRVAILERLDREAATYVESVICMRTHFTGEPPYVGWKGLGLAMGEVFDKRDRLIEILAALGRHKSEAKP